MGSYNHTCGISQLPILEGESVRCFIIMPEDHITHGTDDNTTYSNDLYNPMYLPFKATYDGFGSVDNVMEDWNTAIILSSLRSRISPADQLPLNVGDSVIHSNDNSDKNNKWSIKSIDGDLVSLLNRVDGKNIETTIEQISYFVEPDYTTDFKNLDHALQLIASGDFLMKSLNCHTRLATVTKPALFLIRENIYQQINNTIYTNHYGQKCDQNYWSQLIENAVSRLSEAYHPFPVDMTVQELVSAMAKRHVVFDNATDNPILSLLMGVFSENGRYCLEYKSQAIEAGKAKNKEMLKTISTAFKDQAIFTDAMSSLRKMYIPQTGMGSHKNISNHHIELNKIISSEIKAISKM